MMPEFNPAAMERASKRAKELADGFEGGGMSGKEQYALACCLIAEISQRAAKARGDDDFALHLIQGVPMFATLSLAILTLDESES